MMAKAIAAASEWNPKAFARLIGAGSAMASRDIYKRKTGGSDRRRMPFRVQFLGRLDGIVKRCAIFSGALYTYIVFRCVKKEERMSAQQPTMEMRRCSAHKRNTYADEAPLRLYFSRPCR